MNLMQLFFNKKISTHAHTIHACVIEGVDVAPLADKYFLHTESLAEWPQFAHKNIHHALVLYGLLKGCSTDAPTDTRKRVERIVYEGKQVDTYVRTTCAEVLANYQTNASSLIQAMQEYIELVTEAIQNGDIPPRETIIARQMTQVMEGVVQAISSK